MGGRGQGAAEAESGREACELRELTAGQAQQAEQGVGGALPHGLQAARCPATGVRRKVARNATRLKPGGKARSAGRERGGEHPQTNTALKPAHPPQPGGAALQHFGLTGVLLFDPAALRGEGLHRGNGDEGKSRT